MLAFSDPYFLKFNAKYMEYSMSYQTDLPIRVVCATQKSKEDFFSLTQTGKSLLAFSDGGSDGGPVEMLVAFDNSFGLSAVYNAAIKKSESEPAILVFIHDDIFITDFFWTERVREGLKVFDVIGLAGTEQRKPGDLMWSENHQKGVLSGYVAHGLEFPGSPSYYGKVGKECKLWDGVFLAARSDTLLEHNIKFDPDFDFHFYDLDFCRTVEKANLKMGTIPLAVIHSSGGNFSTPAWRDGSRKYLKKWGS